MRPRPTNYTVFCGPETVILKILTLAKHFLQTDQCFYLIKINAKMMEKYSFYGVNCPKVVGFPQNFS